MPHSGRRAKHFNGTAPSSASTPGGVKIELGRLGSRLLITNLDGANTLEVSLDNGRNWYPILAGVEPFGEDVHVHFLRLRGDGADVDYAVLAFVG